MYLTTSASVVAILTRRGREILSDNSANFKITKFKFADDEIDYSLFNGSSSNAPQPNILGLPIIEPCTNTNGNAELRNDLLTKPQGTLTVAELTTTLPASFDVPLISRILYYIKTRNGYDSLYFISSTDRTVIVPDTDRIVSGLDPDRAAVFKNQSYAPAGLTILKPGNVVITIVGSNTRQTYKSTITVQTEGFDQPTITYSTFQ